MSRRQGGDADEGDNEEDREEPKKTSVHVPSTSPCPSGILPSPQACWALPVGPFRHPTPFRGSG